MHSYGEWHSVDMYIEFVEGDNNDIVMVSVDCENTLVGTTWESYFLQTPGEPHKVKHVCLTASLTMSLVV